jgi:hypothetical protein
MGLNPQPGPWTECLDAPHGAGSSMTLNLLDPAGDWEIRALQVPRGEEPSCNSSDPDAPDVCDYIPHLFKTNVTASLVTVELNETGD